MTTVSNVGGGDSPQMGRPSKPVRGRDGMGMVVAKKGGSYGEHPNARRERLKRILKGGPR